MLKNDKGLFKSFGGVFEMAGILRRFTFLVVQQFDMKPAIRKGRDNCLFPSESKLSLWLSRASPSAPSRELS